MELSAKAKHYLDLRYPPTIEPVLRSFFTKVIWAIDNIISTLLSAFGYNAIRDEDNSGSKSQYRLQLALTAFSSISALATLCITLAGGNALAVMITGATLLIGSALLTLYLKHLRPIPRTIKGWKNLTVKAISGQLGRMNGRASYMDDIANTLLASQQKPKIHPMLIGPSGVGKTKILQDFAAAVAAGDYPNLKGKQVFYINTAEFISTGASLESVKERICGRSNDVILIFDEIHQAFKGGKNGNNLGERLKTFLDDGTNGFPHVIAATTVADYQTTIIENPALERRFKLIPIQPSSEVETLDILRKSLLASPELAVSPDNLKKIYDLSIEHFSTYPQPYMSCRILSQSIVKAKAKVGLELQTQLKNKLAALDSHLTSELFKNSIGTMGQADQAEALQKEKELLGEIDALKDQIKKDETKKQQQLILIERVKLAKENTFKRSIDITKAGKTNRPFILKAFTASLYQNQACQKAQQKSDTGVTQVCEGSIDEVINSELTLLQLRQSASKKTGHKTNPASDSE